MMVGFFPEMKPVTRLGPAHFVLQLAHGAIFTFLFMPAVPLWAGDKTQGIKTRFHISGGFFADTNSLSANGDGAFLISGKALEFSFQAGGQYQMLQGLTNRRYGAAIDTDFKMHSRFELYLNGGYRYTGAGHVADGGFGAKVIYIKGPSIDLSLSLIPMASFEAPDFGPGLWHLRLSFRHRLRLQSTNDSIRFQNTLFYKPDITLWSDFNAEMINLVSVRLNPRLRFEVTHTVHHEGGAFWQKGALGLGLQFGDP